MRFLPWRPLCEHVLLHGSRAGASALTTTAELRHYLYDWSARSACVKDTLERRIPPSAMRDISRLGAWLGDLVNTELCVRARTHGSRVKYVVVLNSSYKALGRKLGLDSGVTSSAKNLGNIFEHLMWLALEEDRCEWILGVLRCLRTGGTATDGASSAGAPGASQPAETETKQRRADSGESSDSEVSAPRSRTSDAFEADHEDDEQAYNDVKQRARCTMR